MNGGKRMRPQLMLLMAESLKVEVKNKTIDLMAAAGELIHCYSLIHDDLPAMDDDDFRRGKPSCHKKFSEAVAILAAIADLPLALLIRKVCVLRNRYSSYPLLCKFLAR